MRRKIFLCIFVIENTGNNQNIVEFYFDLYLLRFPSAHFKHMLYIYYNYYKPLLCCNLVIYILSFNNKNKTKSNANNVFRLSLEILRITEEEVQSTE